MNEAEQSSSSTPEIWQAVWASSDDADFRWWVAREEQSRRTAKILNYVAASIAGIAGRSVIEVGSGAGVMSFNFARKGAAVTLLDYSAEALSLAVHHFNGAALKCTPLQGDAFHPDPSLLERFDMAMSFGTIEHYRYPERLDIAKAHVRYVRPGGVVCISVPNRLFVPHELLKSILVRRGRWHLGYEGAFTPWELRSLGKRIGLQDIRIVGSAVLTDIRRYLSIYSNTRALAGIIGRWPLPTRDRGTPADNLLGSDIVLLGKKPR